ncbi:hypothetical protein HSX37_16395|nr:hypothetical protein [Dendrosporobacter quercicolus]NSL49617.1 hypothetical protein [Dendrosporobacter quercicolus DSM 1736]
MITASIKGGIFTYRYQFRGKRYTISGSKNEINLAVPYLTKKIKKAAQ